jgi:alpha-beta hydrolase superfamily lysophospholipase
VIKILPYFTENANAEPRTEDVYFSASDGIVIHATFYSSSEPGSPTAYLVHDIGEDRSVWDDYSKYLQSNGYNVMALDMRGHGESVDTLNISNPTVSWEDMGKDEFLRFGLDLDAAYEWVQGSKDNGDPHTDAGPNGFMVGVAKGGLFALTKIVNMSREGMMAAAIISPTLDCYRLDVEQVFEDYGDIRPIMLIASEGDGTGNLAMNTILERKLDDGEHNGIGVIMEGSKKGMVLIEDQELRSEILKMVKDTLG